ncbi:hypothetical protein M422DRAFT_158227 [Sphaerobolus stellatus SS14]|nr:hypothetical protein M422DRAFT_158227 [Sphaerobolus stellatus SS14]
MSPPFYLCVDCGGTKTAAVICDASGQIVGRALGGPSNFSYLGVKLFVDVLTTTVQKALYAATLPTGDIEALRLEDKFASVWIGVSGVDSPNDIRTLKNTLSPIFSIPPGNRLQVTNDGNLLASPLNTHPELKYAVAIIAGTGSVVISFARGESQAEGPTPLKEVARVGGWGWILGDLGSAFEISKETVREILARADRRTVEGIAHELDATSVEGRILTHFRVESVPDLFGVLYAPDPLPSTLSDTIAVGETLVALKPRERRLSDLSRIIFQAAFIDHDDLALTVLRRCAADFAALISSILTTEEEGSPKLNAVEAASSILCLGGSLLGISEYRDMILEELKKRGHVFPLFEVVGDGDVATVAAKALASMGSE